MPITQARGTNVLDLDQKHGIEMELWRCFKIGPYANVEHPQDILTLEDRDTVLSLIHASGSMRESLGMHTKSRSQANAQGTTRMVKSRSGDMDNAMELIAASQNGSRVLPQSGSFVTVHWKGVPWTALPLQYWIGMWLEVLHIERVHVFVTMASFVLICWHVLSRFVMS